MNPTFEAQLNAFDEEAEQAINEVLWGRCCVTLFKDAGGLWQMHYAPFCEDGRMTVFAADWAEPRGEVMLDISDPALFRGYDLLAKGFARLLGWRWKSEPPSRCTTLQDLLQEVEDLLDDFNLPRGQKSARTFFAKLQPGFPSLTEIEPKCNLTNLQMREAWLWSSSLPTVTPRLEAFVVPELHHPLNSLKGQEELASLLNSEMLPQALQVAFRVDLLHELLLIVKDRGIQLFDEHDFEHLSFAVN